MSVAKQSEFLFLWDGENWNPNGDMLNDNAPRYDEVSRKALVSDVRIKRTIRDFLEATGEEIFVKETPAQNGKGIMDGKGRVKQMAGNASNKVQAIIEKCIDVRAFGGVFPVDKETNSLTGSIQFKMSKSLHQTEISFIKGTGAFASSEGKENKTFREEYVLPYALFSTYGVVNGFSTSTTSLREDDVQKVLRGLWLGTKNLISRSKFGQLPRFLLKITYKKPGYYVGGLDNLVALHTAKPQENEIKSIGDYALDFSQIITALAPLKSHIESIAYVSDGRLSIASIPEDWKMLDLGL